MASKITIKLSDRSPKKPLKKLPPSMDLSPDTPIEVIKMYIARQVGLSDHNRIGLFDPATKKTLKDRKAAISSYASVVSAGELLVKDLGFQIDWTTVFVVEYLGPILIHCAVLRARPYIYPGADASPAMSTSQWLAFGMIVSHFAKRELETLFVHRFSAATMPWTNIFKNSFFYWFLSGLLAAYTIYSPRSWAATHDSPALDLLGSGLFLFGEVSNALVHLNLAGLRSVGGTERQIPKGYGFSLVTCPNYMFEIVAWVGIIIASRSWAVAVFIAFGAAQMAQWGRQKERAYRKEFPETYKKKRYVMLPGII